MKRFSKYIFSGARTAYTATLALIGLCGVVAVAANYTMTQGSGTTFGSLVVGGVNYAQQTVCDPATPSQCAAVNASGQVSVAPLVAGTAIIGKTGIDQTTPGTTNLVATTARAQLANTGTSNGSIISPLTLTAGGDLNGLTSGSAATLTGGGSAGVSSQANIGSARKGIIYFQTVTAGFTPALGGNISIWFLFSPDGGSTYETTPATPSTTVPALPRAPDCIIPLDNAALGTSALKPSTLCPLPYGTFKVLVQNNAGANFGAGNYTLKLVAFADNN